MATSSAAEFALSVRVRTGSKTLLNKIGSFNMNQSLQELYQSLHVEAADLQLKGVQISASETGPWCDTALNEKITLLQTFNKRHVCYTLETVTEPAQAEVSIDSGSVDGIAEIMRVAATMKLPEKKTQVTQKDRLHNDLLDLLASRGVGFHAQASESEGALVIRVSSMYFRSVTKKFI